MSTLSRDRLLNWAKTARPLLLMEMSHLRKSLSRAASTRVASPIPSAWFPNCAHEHSAPAELRSSQSVVRAAIVHQPAVIPCVRKRARGSPYDTFSSPGPGPWPCGGPGGAREGGAGWSRRGAGRGRCGAGSEGPPGLALLQAQRSAAVTDQRASANPGTVLYSTRHNPR